MLNLQIFITLYVHTDNVIRERQEKEAAWEARGQLFEIPESATLLLGLCLVGLAGFGRKKFNS